jgi:hypothetical protein
MTAQGDALGSAWLRAPPQNRRAIFPMCYGYGVMPSDEFDGNPAGVILEFDPFA